MLYAQNVRNLLFEIISNMEIQKQQFIRNPEKDFSRKRKIGFKETIEIILTMEKDTVKRELMKFFNFCSDSPSDAAFNQQRHKLLPVAFEYLFREFTKRLPRENYFHGYRLLACDGSALHTPTNPNDEESFCQFAKNSKAYNIIHLNALYDLLDHRYVDAVIQPFHKKNEREALYEMLERYPENEKTIFIADRGYISFNVCEHVERKGQKYLLRAKDIHTSSGFLYSAELPDEEEFDILIKETLTRRRLKDNKLEKRRYIRKKTNFNFWNNEDFYPITYRVVRFKLTDDTYECIVTNLSEKEFSTEEIKKLYAMRWGIETSFRELKYAVGLISFHAIKREYIEQEIWARLIVFNFCEAIALRLTVEKINTPKNTKYQYQLNTTTAVYLCRLFLRGIPTITAFKLETMIEENILPVRLGRKFPRYAMPNRPAGFCYRTP